MPQVSALGSHRVEPGPAQAGGRRFDRGQISRTRLRRRLVIAVVAILDAELVEQVVEDLVRPPAPRIGDPRHVREQAARTQHAADLAQRAEAVRARAGGRTTTSRRRTCCPRTGAGPRRPLPHGSADPHPGARRQPTSWQQPSRATHRSRPPALRASAPARRATASRFRIPRPAVGSFGRRGLHRSGRGAPGRSGRSPAPTTARSPPRSGRSVRPGRSPGHGATPR